MAIIRRITCAQCHESKEVWCAPSDYSTICHECIELDIDRTRRLHLAELVSLTLEERIAKIEEWIYDYKPQYVSPPRF